MSLPSRDAAAAAASRRSSNIVIGKGVRAGAKRFRQCFPSVNSKKKKGWKAQPDVGYSLCNDLRKHHNEPIDQDVRIDNALSHRATANARAMGINDRAASAAPTAPATPFPVVFLYKPSEILAADAAGYPSSLPIKLVSVPSNEAADRMVEQGYRRFDQHTTYQTLAQLPASPADAPAADGRQAHLLPPPGGEIVSLPPKMPKLYAPKEGDPQKSVADIIVECFEIKVIDEAAGRTWHPIRMWPSEARERKRLGYDDATNLNNRLKAYYAIKCGKYSTDELKDQSASNLMSMGVTAKAGITSTYFELAVEIYNREQRIIL